MGKLTIEDLNRIRQEEKKEVKNWIRLGYSTCGIAAGAREVFDTLAEEIKKRNLDVEIKKCGCIGMCYAEPLVEIQTEGLPRVFYGKVNHEIAVEIVEKHLGEKMLLNDRIYDVKVNR